MAQLILVRHGQSLWNALNKFTGWVDVPLSERGRAEATIASCRLSGYRVNVCFTSKLIRAIETATTWRREFGGYPTAGSCLFSEPDFAPFASR